MNPIRTAITAALVVLLAACSSTASSPSSDPEPTVTAEPTEEPTPTEEPSEEPSPTDEPTEEPSATPVGGGGFTVAPNPAADGLFLVRDDCQNLRDGYRLEFPEDWYTNTEYRDYPPCVWFSPTFYETDGDEVPAEIAIAIEWVPGDVGSTDADIVTTEEVTVGGQTANRVEWDDDSYWYVIQLGPTLEEGPNLWVQTSAEMGGDYELNKAVMDRMMATIEFIGSTQ
jgi:hypothetical protein